MSWAAESAPEPAPEALEFKGFREVIRPLPGRTATRPEISALKLISDGTRLAARPGSAPTRAMVRQQMAELEAFLVSNPDSAYGADLRRQLARYYRSIGRYSLSLERWQEVLNETLQFTEGFGKEIADESLAERMSLLASLGRADELQEIKDQMRGRRLDGGFRTMQFRTALESLAMMRRRLEISFQCGPFAVAEVARRLTGNWVSGISGAESPETGFSAYELVRLANGAGVNLRAAWRESGDTVVVPSVVHWGDDHWGSLLESSWYSLSGSPLFDTGDQTAPARRKSLPRNRNHMPDAGSEDQ